MKTERVIRQLEDLKDHCKDFANDDEDGNVWSNDIEALDVAIKILEKQIRVNPNGYDNGGAEDYEEWAECPKCSESIPEYTLENETECYCIGCGQKLKWEVEG